MKNYGKSIRQNPYSFLFASIVALFLVLPAFPSYQNIYGSFFLLLVMLSTVYVLHMRKTVRRLCLLLGLIAYGLTVLNVQEGGAAGGGFTLSLLTILAYILFFTLCIAVFLRRIFYSRRAGWDSIQGGLSVYFLLGIFWTFLYQLVLLMDPGAVSFGTGNHTIADTLYFSFMTLTSVGYGDHLPVSHVAQSLAMLEAVFGQFFLTVFIARLVGLHLLER